MQVAVDAPLVMAEHVNMYDWNDGEVFEIGASLQEVSEWLGRHHLGFNSFSDIEEMWERSAQMECERNVGRSNKGVTKLKSLQCSIHHEGRKNGGRKGEVGASVDLSMLYLGSR